MPVDVRHLTRRGSIRSVPAVVVAALAVFYTLFLARAFLVPIAYAVLLNLLLSPVVRLLGRAHLPPLAGAAVIVLALIGTLVVGGYGLSGPVQRWVDGAPATLSRAQSKVRRLMAPLRRVQETANQVERQTDVNPDAKKAAVVVEEPGLSAQIFSSMKQLVAGMLEVVILLFFLMAAGDLFLKKLIRVLPNVGDKKKAVLIARRTQSSISTYLLTLLTINVVEGVVVGAAMWAIGMPTPILWGAVVTVLEFIPYLGAMTLVLIFATAGLTTFDSVGHALLVPAAYLVINVVQANLVTPILLGRRLSLNPVAVVLGLSFWFWIWGVPGAFIAVPLLAVFRIICEHTESLQPVAEFLGQADDGHPTRPALTA